MATDVKKQLASTERAGTFPRRKARLAQRAFVQEHWRRLSGAYLVLAVLGTLPALFPGPPFLRGLVVGLVLAGGLGALVNLVLVLSGTGPTLAGERAERWTVEELRPLLQLGYELVNNVDVDGHGDVDHVLVGPSGVFVLETKWSSHDWSPSSPYVRPAVESVRRHARTTWLQLKRHGAEQARPVLVLWGAAATSLSAGTGVGAIGTVTLVTGEHLQRWLLAQPSGRLDGRQVTDCHDQLTRIAVRGDRYADPVPLGVDEILNRTLLAAGIAAATFVGPLSAGALHWALPLLALPLMVLSFGLRRRRRLYGTAALGGASGALLLYAAIWIYALVASWR